MHGSSLGIRSLIAGAHLGRPKAAYNLAKLTRTKQEVRSMPIYEYVCQKCKKSFELIRRIKENGRKAATCPKCASKKVERRWSRVSVATSHKS